MRGKEVQLRKPKFIYQIRNELRSPNQKSKMDLSEADRMKKIWSFEALVQAMEPSTEELEYRKEKCEESDFVQKYSKLFKCTKCHLNIKPVIVKREKVPTHPCLGVIMCQKCCDYYEDGEFSLDSDGEDKYCRWCGEGGTIFSCSKCICGFCASCIKQHFKSEYFKQVQKDENWLCFFCNPKPLWELRFICSLAFEMSQNPPISSTDLKKNLGKNVINCEVIDTSLSTTDDQEDSETQVKSSKRKRGSGGKSREKGPGESPTELKDLGCKLPSKTPGEMPKVQICASSNEESDPEIPLKRLKFTSSQIQKSSKKSDTNSFGNTTDDQEDAETQVKNSKRKRGSGGKSREKGPGESPTELKDSSCKLPSKTPGEMPKVQICASSNEESDSESPLMRLKFTSTPVQKSSTTDDQEDSETQVKSSKRKRGSGGKSREKGPGESPTELKDSSCKLPSKTPGEMPKVQICASSNEESDSESPLKRLKFTSTPIQKSSKKSETDSFGSIKSNVLSELRKILSLSQHQIDFGVTWSSKMLEKLATPDYITTNKQLVKECRKIKQFLSVLSGFLVQFSNSVDSVEKTLLRKDGQRVPYDSPNKDQSAYTNILQFLGFIKGQVKTFMEKGISLPDVLEAEVYDDDKIIGIKKKPNSSSGTSTQSRSKSPVSCSNLKNSESFENTEQNKVEELDKIGDDILELVRSQRGDFDEDEFKDHESSNTTLGDLNELKVNHDPKDDIRDILAILENA